MITAYIMDTDSTEWKLETIDDEKLDKGDDLDEFGTDIDAIDFFGYSVRSKDED